MIRWREAFNENVVVVLQPQTLLSKTPLISLPEARVL